MSKQAPVHAFRAARRRADIERVLARLRGRSADLLCYDEVRDHLESKETVHVGVQNIPIEAIVGSVERCSDYTRTFLPLKDSDELRWTGVKEAVSAFKRLPPIRVYQVGDVFFLLDGHHRVSVARERGRTWIEAIVVEIKTSVPLLPGARPDNLLLEVQHADLMERTGLHQGRPGADLRVTIPGEGAALEAQIEAHRQFIGIEQRREVAIEEAANAWYDTVYLPVVQALRDGSTLVAFPGQTEADAYLWICRHRAALSDALGWEIRSQVAIADLVRQSKSSSPSMLARVGRKLRKSTRHDPVTAGQLPGTWWTERGGTPREACLFANILVPISGEVDGWTAVTQAAELASREGARLVGLHVVPARAEMEGPQVQALQTEFAQHCEATGALGTVTIATGRVGKVLERFRWADLVVMGLPQPHRQPLGRRMSVPRQLLRCWPTPVLVVPDAPSPLRRPLVAYDGGRKARGALCFAATLAVQEQVRLTVVSVEEDGVDAGAALAEARIYLERNGIDAALIGGRGPAGKAILKTAEDQKSDLILMGGFGRFPMLDVLFGSVVDEVLRASHQPVLVYW